MIPIYSKRAKRNFMSFYMYGGGSFSILSPLYVFILDFEFIMLLMVIIHVSIGILSIRTLIWLIRGEETIYIKNNNLVIERHGTFWLSNTLLNLTEIEQFCIYKNYIEENHVSNGIGGEVIALRNKRPIFKIQNVGRIKIIMKNGKQFKMLNGLSVIEGRQVILKMDQLVSKASNTT